MCPKCGGEMRIIAFITDALPLIFLCAVKVHFTSGCKSRPRNCRCTSVAIGRGHGAKATVVLEAPRQKASERGLSKHAGRNASEA